ncbi:MAG: hypothetical protein GY729_16860, partial [Desulfobacteraceae bacterium]|nr:hypothetical protein [Desulfobacteraceae bacterium]
MEKIMDKVWMLMVSFLDYCVRILDFLFSPLEIIGPWFVIFVLTLIVVFFTRCLSRVYVTKRYLKLKKEFDHWRHVREQALKHPDKDKAKQLAKNIDQAKLNRVYYDYFFEGFLKNMITNLLPVFLMFAYVSIFYTPQTLFDRFAHKLFLSLSFGH